MRCLLLVASVVWSQAKENPAVAVSGGFAGMKPSEVTMPIANQTTPRRCVSYCGSDPRCQSGCSNSGGGICCIPSLCGTSACHWTGGCQSGCASNVGVTICCAPGAAADSGEVGAQA